ncbi:MAG: GFA family protein, partial [Methylococcales bacterium]
VCGSPLLSRFDHNPSVFSLPLGTFDDDPKIKPVLHAFVGSKAPWFDITDNLPQFQELPK